MDQTGGYEAAGLETGTVTNNNKKRVNSVTADTEYGILLLVKNN